MIMVGGKPFVPFKCAGSYLGGYGLTWLKEYFPRTKGYPKKVYLSERRSGWWKSDLDQWLRKRKGNTGASRSRAA